MYQIAEFPEFLGIYKCTMNDPDKAGKILEIKRFKGSTTTEIKYGIDIISIWYRYGFDMVLIPHAQLNNKICKWF